MPVDPDPAYPESAHYRPRPERLSAEQLLETVCDGKPKKAPVLRRLCALGRAEARHCQGRPPTRADDPHDGPSSPVASAPSGSPSFHPAGNGGPAGANSDRRGGNPSVRGGTQSPDGSRILRRALPPDAGAGFPRWPPLLSPPLRPARRGPAGAPHYRGYAAADTGGARCLTVRSAPSTTAHFCVSPRAASSSGKASPCPKRPATSSRSGASRPTSPTPTIRGTGAGIRSTAPVRAASSRRCRGFGW